MFRIANVDLKKIIRSEKENINRHLEGTVQLHHDWPKAEYEHSVRIQSLKDVLHTGSEYY